MHMHACDIYVYIRCLGNRWPNFNIVDHVPQRFVLKQISSEFLVLFMTIRRMKRTKKRKKRREEEEKRALFKKSLRLKSVRIFNMDEG